MIKSLSTVMANRKSFALPTLIILLVLAAIFAAGTVSFVVQSLRHDALRAQKHQALMAAQAGLMKAAYEILENDVFTPGSNQLDGPQHYAYQFVGSGGGGGAGDWVYIDPSASQLTNSNRNVSGWTIVNVNPFSNFTLTHMTVSWSGGGRQMNEIQLQGASKWTGSQGTSGSLTDIADTVIPFNSTVTNNFVRFNSQMLNRTVSALFHFSDGTTIESTLTTGAKPLPPTQDPTTIQSTGLFVDNFNSAIMKQTMLATFEAVTGTLKFTRYNETTEHMAP